MPALKLGTALPMVAIVMRPADCAGGAVAGRPVLHPTFSSHPVSATCSGTATPVNPLITVGLRYTCQGSQTPPTTLC